MLNVNKFISDYIIARPVSLFAQDIEANKVRLSEEIQGKKVLVIGGAGTIGSSYIRAILPFRPSELVVVDISENGLTELTLRFAFYIWNYRSRDLSYLSHQLCRPYL